MALPHTENTNNKRLASLARQIRRDLETIATQRGRMSLDEAQDRINTRLFELMDMARGNEQATERLAEVSRIIRQSILKTTEDAIEMTAGATANMNDMYEALNEITAELRQIEKRHLMLESAIKHRDSSHEVVGQLIDEGRELEREWIIEAGFSLTKDPASDIAYQASTALDGFVEEYDVHDFTQLLHNKLEHLSPQLLEELGEFIEKFNRAARDEGVI